MFLFLVKGPQNWAYVQADKALSKASGQSAMHINTVRVEILMLIGLADGNDA
ncbi:MAG: hypothetical protein HRT83_06130 [Hyphomicrobiaceae bacterium]|nr:hypothetical protein [Hyphomicrobiaceae bacterium]